VYTATSLSYLIDGAYTSLKPTPNIEGVSVTVTVVEVTSPVVFTQTTLSIGFLPGSDLASTNLIEIGFPSEFAFTPTTELCTQITPSSASLTCTYSSTNGYITSILVSNPCSVSD
jgi:hypothetical protein